MLTALLIRDWKLHKDALLLLGVIVLLMVAASFLSHPQMEERFLMALLGRIAFGLGCLLPFLVHARELQQGTLGDVLALPIARRELVTLRWVEAVISGTLFFLVVTLPGLHHFTFRELAQAHANGTLLWILLWAFAAQLPFQLRFGQKGGIAFAATLLLMEGWAAANMPAKEFATSPAMVQKFVYFLQTTQRAWAALGAAAPYAELVVVGLLLWGAFHLAIWGVERCDA